VAELTPWLGFDVRTRSFFVVQGDCRIVGTPLNAKAIFEIDLVRK
jgi:hypothetical protein